MKKEPLKEEATNNLALVQANPLMNRSYEAGEAPTRRIFRPPSPIESNHLYMSVINTSQHRLSTGIDSAGLENGNAKHSPSASNSPCLRTGKRVLCPTTGQALQRSRKKPSYKDGQPQPVASASLGLVHSLKVSKAAGKKKLNSQQGLNISQKVSSGGLLLSSSVNAVEPQPSLDRVTLRRSKWINLPVPSVAKDPTRTASTHPFKRAVQSKPERNVVGNLATRSSAKPQGILKRQPAKTTRGKARNE
jgi:hypothetical protein